MFKKIKRFFLLFFGYEKEIKPLKTKTLYYSIMKPSLRTTPMSMLSTAYISNNPDDYYTAPIVELKLYSEGRWFQTKNYKILCIIDSNEFITEIDSKTTMDAEERFNELCNFYNLKKKFGVDFRDILDKVFDEHFINNYVLKYREMYEACFEKSKHSIINTSIGVTPIGTMDLDLDSDLMKFIKENKEDLENKIKKQNEKYKDMDTVDILLDKACIQPIDPEPKESLNEKLNDKKSKGLTEVTQTKTTFKPRMTIMPSGNGWYTDMDTGKKYHGKKNLPNDYVIMGVDLAD